MSIPHLQSQDAQASPEHALDGSNSLRQTDGTRGLIRGPFAMPFPVENA